jgi:outer membrane receptor protein involved in Fe transport
MRPKEKGGTDMAHRGRITHARLMCGAAMLALLSSGSVAVAQESAKFNIAPQPLASALNEFAVQSPWPILYTSQMTGGKTTAGVNGETDPELALNTLLQGTGLSYRREGNTFLIVSASDPQSGSAAGDGADSGTVQALIVTAQKREENIQDVPIAMSAFTQEDLTRSQVTGGPDLMTQVPNMTFTKTNFTSYSIQIRGIGTQAISATTDPAVAVAFNNTPFVRNRFFEQEFYDLQRVEVLRGPQGTLYGRNATAGVVNIISAKPKFAYEAKLSVDVGNYNSQRFEGMINLPLAEDKVALRIAGAWTKRDGYDINQLSGNRIDGRDLWSTRASLRFTPTDRLDVNLIWEHFQENDDRLRAGKQLCKRDVVTHVGDVPVNFFDAVPDYGQQGAVTTNVQSAFSQGCLPNSLYDKDSFQVPNGYALPYATLGSAAIDPYMNATQSRDLRVIESAVDPKYQAKSDVVELQFTTDLSDTLSLTSETAWSHDFVYGLQDLNRFNTRPGIFGPDIYPESDITFGAYKNGPNGLIFCDPQIGCSDRLVAMDLATAKSDDFSQELRLASNFDGPFNFSLGANFLRYDTEDKYYVFANKLTSAAVSSGVSQWNPGVSDNRDCLQGGPRQPDYGKIYQVFNCTYIDPNPFGSLNDQGHNYFLSKNPYKLISYAVFGEVYYKLTDALKVTAGLRWTVDKKEAPRIPTWVLGSDTVGFSVLEVVDQEWREPTGRLAIDWKPDLSFTDDTLIYGSYAHGYKAGGANPPPYGIIMFCQSCGSNTLVAQGVLEHSVTQPKTFDPEFVNAFEVGAKNTLLDGRMTLNLAGFYYDYTGYQISQIVNRSAVNLNFDAKVWGLEVEADWRPLENLRLGFKGGYEKTRVADGMKAVDIMDRTAGHPGWMVVKPFPTFPSNCILPIALYTPPSGTIFDPNQHLWGLGGPNGGNPGGCELAYFMGVDPGTERPFGEWNGTAADATGAMSFWADPTEYPGFDPNQPGINHGEGFYKDLSGHELPNAPHFTATITADYTIPLPNDWLATLHTDFYYQSEAWTRIFNTPGYDKLKAYTNVNLAAIFSNEDAGWKVMAYVKNVFDKDAITGSFLFSDDTGLTTNVFLNEPRLYGLRVTKEFSGGPWWTGANPNHPAGEPYPLTVEIGGMIQRQDAPYASLTPSFSNSFKGALDPAQAQGRNLDWGDGRSVALIYSPAGAQWNVSASYRIGRTNGTDKNLVFKLGAKGCIASQALCATSTNPKYYFNGYNYSDVTVTNREEHHIVDFGVGRDVGLGMGVESRIGGGLRYANLQSKSRLQMWGVPDWYVPAQYAFFKYSHNTHYKADLSTTREFTGLGPTLSWDAAKRLWGGDNGRLDLDWSLTGGVLFGKQKASFKGTESSAYFSGKYYSPGLSQVGPTQSIGTTPSARSKSVTVPLVDLSLGLSYEIQRVKVGAGYRWERYFNVLDAGYAEHKDVDRTIDGPYFKIAVGFGG